MTADGWVVGTDAVVTVRGIVGAVAVAAWLVVARADAVALRLPRADGRGRLFGAWLLVVAAAAATEVAVGGGFSWDTRQAMSSAGPAGLGKIGDHDNGLGEHRYSGWR